VCPRLGTSIDLMTRTNAVHRIADLARAAGDVFVRLDGAGEAAVSGLSYDSRTVAPGDLFFCVPGSKTDGHAFARDAVARGAAAFCVERLMDVDTPQIVVSRARTAMARIAASYFGRPADHLTLIGVTGTNGKTTTTWLLESILAVAGRVPALIGTITTRFGGATRPGVRTTPESVDLQRLLAEMLEVGADAVAMEVTSHALALERVEAVRFASAAFTNLSQDHLDFHAGMDDYFEAKRSLFTPPRLERGAVNVDDPYGAKLMAIVEVPCIGFGIGAGAEIRATNVELGPRGSRFTVEFPGGTLALHTTLVGAFNVYNCLAAAAAALQANVEPAHIENGIARVRAVPGRFESVDRGQPFSVVVDYAHTPDSLKNILIAARDLAGARGGRVLCVFGCGGDRDRTKRPLMGAVARRGADYVVVTSDNPRSEDPQAIIDDILTGLTAAPADAVIADRAAAIELAIATAVEGDVVVIAGKGHETGQEFADRTVPFDDRIVARAALERRGFGDTP
jgi:UDP-N-acetylmuramoyl-L-alanyl-D-glutamate--2,6-diaminopimelate ligase